jgi:iron complex transport system ATP-binding protein
MSDTLFSLKNVRCGYEDKIVLHGISMDVKKGEFMGIIGPNGSGKTTLLKTLTRVLAPAEGIVKYKDRGIFDINPKSLAREVAYVSQETVCAFSFSVLDIVLMGRYPHLGRFRTESKNDLEVARKSLEAVGCIELLSKDIDRISAGERQRVLIARALAQEPEVLVLDEPTSRLDIGHRIEIFDIIKELNKNHGITVIAVLHDLNLASDYCGRIVFMDNGSIFASGPAEEILTYQNIEKVYKTTVLVKESPATGKPHVVLVPGERR